MSVALRRRPTTLRRGTIADEIREKLADEIVVGRHPPGTRLDEQSLADHFGVSRTPVREALKQLAAIGLVEPRPRKGVVVAQISPERLILMFEALSDLESCCAGHAALRMNDHERQQLADVHELTRVTVEASDAERFDYLNREFHALILTGSHNTFLSEPAFALRTRLMPFWRIQFWPLEWLAPALADHQVVLGRILAKDADGAFAAMRGHLAATRAFFSPEPLCQAKTP